MFEAGAIAFRLQTVGSQVFTKEIDQADRSMGQLGRTSQTTATLLEQSGRRATDSAAKYRLLSTRLQETERNASTVGRVFLGAGIAIAAGIALAVVKFAQYDKALDSLGANAGVQGDVLDELGDSAIDAGRKFGFTAVEAVGAEEALVKAGVQVRDVLGGALVGSLTLAAAGTLGVADAAEIASIAMTQFKLEGKDVPRIADLLAAGAGKAVGDVSDLALALRQGGLVASQFDLSLEETVGTLSAFASAGLIGSDSGTSFKAMLLALASPTGLAKAELKKYNIEAYDAQGNFIGITALAGELQTKLGGLSAEQRNSALSIIFGNDAIRSAKVLYDQGATGIANWVDKVDDSGYAAEQARKKLDNLAGDVTKLGSSFDRALIKSGSAANDVLRDLVQDVTQLIDWVGSLDEGTLSVGLSIGVGTAALLLFAGVVLTAVPRIAAFKLALDDLGTTFGVTAVRAAAAGAALGILTALIGASISELASAKARVDAYAESLDDATGGITKYTRELAIKQLQEAGAFDVAQKLGYSQKELTDAVLEGGDAFEEINKKIVDYGNTINPIAGIESFNASNGIQHVRKELEQSKDAWENASAAGDENVDITGAAADSYDDLGGQVDGVVSSIKDLANELDALNGKNLDAREAARQLEDAYDSFDESLAKNGQTLDITTEAGRENQAALDDIAQAALDSGQAIIDAGGSYDTYRSSLEGSREQLLQRITDLGYSGDAAAELADQILRIPSATEWEAYVKTQNAQLELDSFVRTNDGRTIAINVAATRNYADGGISYFANGSERHVAQIARAGSMRVWAEPETGGEAYIPLSPAKRPRSEALLAQVAQQFGGTYVPGGAKSFANGDAPTDAQIMGGRRGGGEQRIVGSLELRNGRAYISGVIQDDLRGM